MATYLDYLMGVGETGATLGSGAMAGLLGMPYGVYKGATSGKLGTREANRIAEEEARRFMEQYTYQPRGNVAPEMMQTLGGLLESSKLPPVIPEAAMLASIPRQPMHHKLNALAWPLNAKSRQWLSELCKRVDLVLAC